MAKFLKSISRYIFSSPQARTHDVLDDSNGVTQRALRQRDRKVFEYSRSEGRADALAAAADEARALVAGYQRAKEEAEVRTKTLEVELKRMTAAKNSAETHAQTLLATISDNEAVRCLGVSNLCSLLLFLELTRAQFCAYLRTESRIRYLPFRV